MREVAAANLIDRKSEVHLLNSKAVDGPEVIAHGDNIVNSIAPLRSQLESFFTIGMVTGFIIGNKHEGSGAILVVTQTIVVHGTVVSASQLFHEGKKFFDGGSTVLSS